MAEEEDAYLGKFGLTPSSAEEQAARLQTLEKLSEFARIRGLDLNEKGWIDRAQKLANKVNAQLQAPLIRRPGRPRKSPAEEYLDLRSFDTEAGHLESVVKCRDGTCSVGALAAEMAARVGFDQDHHRFEQKKASFKTTIITKRRRFDQLRRKGMSIIKIPSIEVARHAKTSRYPWGLSQTEKDSLLCKDPRKNPTDR